MAINVKDLTNVVELKGVVAGYKIEKRDSKMMWDDEKQGLKVGDPVVQYNGYIQVQTGENQFATINVQKQQRFYNGELDGTSQALEAMASENVETYRKTRDFSKTPTIRIYGGARLQDNYYVRQGEVQGGLRAELGFGYVTLGEPVETQEFENVLNLAVYVNDIQPEVDKEGEETGRAVVEAVFPYSYGSEKKGNQVIRATKMKFVAGAYEDEQGVYDLGSDLLKYGEDELLDLSCLFIGELNTYYVDEEPQQQEEQGERRGFGKSARRATNTKRTSVSEYLLTGVDVIGDGECFSQDDIKDALQARARDIEEKKRLEEEKGSKEEAGVTRGRGNFGGGSSPKPAGVAGGTRPAGRERRNF